MSLPFVLPTKLRRPQLDVDLIWRDTLVARLNAALEAPLTLLSAPAGFGKTTLVCQWLARLDASRPSPVPTAWLSLDPQDSDLGVFLPYFVASLRTVFPDACAATLGLLGGSQWPDDTRLATTLVNELEQLRNVSVGEVSSDFIVVLDDYDTIEGTAVDTLLSEILRHPPSGMHLVLVSRKDPSLPLSRLRANRQLVEIRARDLRLTDAEIAQALRAAVPASLSDAEISVVAHATEGWAAAVHLTSDSLRDTEDPAHVVAGLAAAPGNVAGFMVDEVLARQPEEVKDVLICLSVLDRFCAPLIDAICPGVGGGGEALLKHFRAANLFLTGLDAQDEWFRFHQLFQGLLQRQLRRRYDATGVAAIHRLASAWFARQGLVEEALQHALAGEDVAAAAGIFARYRQQMMNEEQWLRLDRWLRLFPAAAHSEYPDLLLARAWVTHTLSGGILAVKDFVPEIEASVERLERRGGDARYQRAELDVLRGMLFYHGASDGRKTIFHTQRALDILPRDWYLVRSYAWLFLSGGYQLIGETANVHRAIAAGTDEDNIPVATMRARALIAGSFLYWVEADLSAMALAATRVTALGGLAARAETLAWGYHFQAVVHYERNELAEAEQAARTLLRSPDAQDIAYPMLLSAFVFARTLQARGHAAEARQIADEIVARSVARQSPTLMSVGEAFQADLMVRQGNVVGAARWLAKVGGSLPLAPMPLYYAPQLTPARILLAQNTPASRERAADLLSGLRDFVTATHNRRVLIEVLALQALLCDAHGDRLAAYDILRQSLDLAQPSGLVRVFADLGPNMMGMLNRLGREGVHPVYVARILAASRSGVSSLPLGDTWVEPLTARETEVLALLAERHTTKEIAHMLVISPETVKRHISSCCHKLHATSRREAVTRARDFGLLPQLV